MSILPMDIDRRGLLTGILATVFAPVTMARTILTTPVEQISKDFKPAVWEPLRENVDRPTVYICSDPGSEHDLQRHDILYYDDRTKEWVKIPVVCQSFDKRHGRGRAYF